MILDPKNFDNVQDLINKVINLRAQFKECDNEKNDIQLVYNVFNKWGFESSYFFSIFHMQRLTM